MSDKTKAQLRDEKCTFGDHVPKAKRSNIGRTTKVDIKLLEPKSARRSKAQAKRTEKANDRSVSTQLKNAAKEKAKANKKASVAKAAKKATVKKAAKK